MTGRKWGKANSWGRWHTGENTQPCPQGDGSHTDLEAIVLNERDAEYNRAIAHARNKQWLGAEGPGRGTSAT